MYTNYWKEIESNIEDVFDDLKGIVLLTHNSIEFKEIIDIINKIKKEHFNNILYISLQRSYHYMISVLDLKPIENKHIFFIDCVTGFAFPREANVDDCLYHKPPLNLNKMKEIINFGINKCNPDLIIIDSLSQFINFTKPTKDEISDLYEFLNTIRNKSINIIQNTFILLYDTKLGLMQNLPKESTDLILKIESFNDK